MKGLSTTIIRALGPCGVCPWEFANDSPTKVRDAMLKAAEEKKQRKAKHLAQSALAFFWIQKHTKQKRTEKKHRWEAFFFLK